MQRCSRTALPLWQSIRQSSHFHSVRCGIGFPGTAMTSSLYAQGRRALVIHEDDVGMTHGSNVAFRELSERGVVSSGSVMAPCPWFPETLEMAAANASLDLGVHLTLNAEKRPVKWRPLTRPPQSAGLTDEHGYFWQDPRQV